LTRIGVGNTDFVILAKSFHIIYFKQVFSRAGQVREIGAITSQQTAAGSTAVEQPISSLILPSF
jgi:hypothetical protein